MYGEYGTKLMQTYNLLNRIRLFSDFLFILHIIWYTTTADCNINVILICTNRITRNTIEKLKFIHNHCCVFKVHGILVWFINLLFETLQDGVLFHYFCQGVKQNAVSSMLLTRGMHNNLSYQQMWIKHWNDLTETCLT